MVISCLDVIRLKMPQVSVYLYVNIVNLYVTVLYNCILQYCITVYDGTVCSLRNVHPTVCLQSPSGQLEYSIESVTNLQPKGIFDTDFFVISRTTGDIYLARDLRTDRAPDALLVRWWRHLLAEISSKSLVPSAPISIWPVEIINVVIPSSFYADENLLSHWIIWSNLDQQPHWRISKMFARVCLSGDLVKC